MNIIEEMLQNVRRLQRDLPAVCAQTVNDDPDVFEDAQRDQMNRSENVKGRKITPKYSKAYAQFKGKANPDLNLTGAFQKAIKTSATRNEVTVTSSDEKKKWLVKRYKDDIFGFNNKSVQQIEKNTKFTNALKVNILKFLKV